MYRKYKREHITRKILEVEAQLQAEGLGDSDLEDVVGDGTMKRPDRRLALNVPN